MSVFRGAPNAPNSNRSATLAVILIGVACALAAATPLAAAYTFQALGTFGELSSEPTAINESGQVAGTLTGT